MSKGLQGLQSRYWIGTSFRDTFDHGECDYCRWQRERCPDTGKLHWQFFIVFSSRKRLESVRKLFPGDHLERVRDIDAADKYCSKVDTRVEGPFEYGKLSRSNTKLDPVALCKRSSATDIIGEFPHLWRSLRVLQDLRAAFAPRRHDMTKGWYLHGDPASGKSTIVSKIADYLGEENVYYKDETKWWNRYDGQSLVVYDDVPLPNPLSILNHIPYNVESKGGVINFNSKWVFLISNNPFSDYLQCFPTNNIPAVKRRFVVNECRLSDKSRPRNG